MIIVFLNKLKSHPKSLHTTIRNMASLEKYVHNYTLKQLCLSTTYYYLLILWNNALPKIWKYSICVDWCPLFEIFPAKKEVRYLVTPFKKGPKRTMVNISLTEKVDPGLGTITIYSFHENMNAHPLVNH